VIGLEFQGMVKKGNIPKTCKPFVYNAKVVSSVLDK
jgi:hypothetical protein